MNQTLVELAPDGTALAGTAPAGAAPVAAAAGTASSAPKSAGPGAADEIIFLPEVRGRIPSWVISLIGHLLILVALWPIHFATMMFREPEVTASVTGEETFSTIPQELRFDTASAPEIGNGGDNSSEASLRMAPLGSAIETPKSPPVINVTSSASSLAMKQITVGRPLADVGIATTNRELSDLIETTGSTEHAGGVR